MLAVHPTASGGAPGAEQLYESLQDARSTRNNCYTSAKYDTSQLIIPQ